MELSDEKKWSNENEILWIISSSLYFEQIAKRDAVLEHLLVKMKCLFIKTKMGFESTD
jgi:hypothetical protein